MTDLVGTQSSYRWVVLAVGTLAQASTAAFFQGLASVGPAIRAEGGLTLGQLGIVLGAPMAGFVLTLFPWGLASDRLPERAVMTVGLLGTAGLLVVSSTVHGLWPLSVALGLTGAAAASVNAASGRTVIRWFVRERRGFAMGLRQTSIPLGAAVAAAVLPFVVQRAGLEMGLRTLALGTLVAAVASWLWIREPPTATDTPTARSAPSATGGRQRFWLVTLAGSGLVICQSSFISFVVELVHAEGLTLGAAGAVFVAAQVCGAVGRVLVGLWSDAARDRIAPLIVLAAVIGLAQGVLALTVGGATWLLVAVAVPAGALAICWNGLVFTAVGEMAPPHRTGAALGLQSTANYLLASVTPWAMGSLIGAHGFRTGYLCSGAAGLLVSLVLVRARHGQTIREELT